MMEKIIKIIYKIVVNVIVIYFDVNVDIFEKMFNINVNCTDYMHEMCFETNYSYVVTYDMS